MLHIACCCGFGTYVIELLSKKKEMNIFVLSTVAYLKDLWDDYLVDFMSLALFLLPLLRKSQVEIGNFIIP
jgi:hypothetical protein